MSAVAVAQRCRGPADLFSPVIVRNMWLTGVDTPSLCPVYMGKPMRGEAPNNRLQRTALRAAAEPERSTDRTAARTVVLRPVGFFEACEARVGKMLLLRRSPH